MARAGMSDEEMTAFLKEMFCVDSTFTAADLLNAAELAAAILADGVHEAPAGGRQLCISIYVYVWRGEFMVECVPVDLPALHAVPAL